MDRVERILVVDDDELQLRVLSRILGELGYETVTADSGARAMELVGRDVDLVLLDIVMPDMDGFEVARGIRRNSPAPDVPIMMVTSLEGRAERIRAVEAGANDFIAKPVDATELRVRARSLLDMKASQDQVRRYQADLETMVAERTAELARAYQDLETEVERRRSYELELVEAKVAAEEANSAKTRFLANVSHELRTPLNGIIGLTQILLGSELTDKQRDYLGMLSMSAEHLLGIVSNILDLSSIELGRLDIEPVEFDLRREMERRVEPFAQQAGAKGLDLAWSTAPDVPAKVTADPRRLGQVLANLLSNAVKFTDRGGIDLTVRLEGDGRGEGTPTLLFSVRDSGPGISSEFRRAVFDRFTIAEDVMTKKSGGTGLGLAICRELVDAMGGRIWVECGGEGGSDFRFTLPVRPERPSVPAGRV